MKKALLSLIAFILVVVSCPKSYAESDTIALLTKNGFFDKGQPTFLNPYDEVKKTLCLHVKYSNTYDLDNLKLLYAPNYVNADGLNKEVYFDLIKKTWENYNDIKYKIEIKNIEVNGDYAIAQLGESAFGTTASKSGVLADKGFLQSDSSSVYYFEKINNEWKIVSDYIIFEKTYLTYGSARDVQIVLGAPCQVQADTTYTASLDIKAPKDTFVLASIGKEVITYPQAPAEEIYRKLSDSGRLERIFKSNNQNINEYTVASFGMTKVDIKNGSELKIYITGLGFAMSRVNVVPTNNFVKVAGSEKIK